MKTEKKEVINFLATQPKNQSEAFNEAFALYRASDGKNLSQERHLNKIGATGTGLLTVIYELKKIHNVSDYDVKKAAKDILNLQVNPDQDLGKELKLSIVSNELANEIKKVFETAPDEVKTEIKFRDEFSFINDVDLPEELKILITDKFGHYYKFVDAHTELSTKLAQVFEENETTKDKAWELTYAEIFELAKKAVENFQADQTIWLELNHYKETKTLLGNHPIFGKRKAQDAVDKMTIAEAAKRAANLDNYVRRDTTKAENATTPEDKQKFEQKVNEWKTELVLVNLKLGISAEK